LGITSARYFASLSLLFFIDFCVPVSVSLLPLRYKAFTLTQRARGAAQIAAAKRHRHTHIHIAAARIHDAYVFTERRARTLARACAPPLISRGLNKKSLPLLLRRRLHCEFKKSRPLPKPGFLFLAAARARVFSASIFHFRQRAGSQVGFYRARS
jgi:hypothetical protein